ncbi:MAG: NifU family protein [Terriglobales bacterium]
MSQKLEFQARTERIEELVRTLERADDPHLHAIAVELMQSVMELHGAGLQKLLEITSHSPDGDRLVEEFLQDDLVSSLLLLHELHPDDMETRVLHAVEKMRPALQQQSADAELLGIEDGVIRLRVHGASGGGCHSASPSALRKEVEEAIYQAAPDALEITIEEVEHSRPAQLVTLK